MTAHRYYADFPLPVHSSLDRTKLDRAFPKVAAIFREHVERAPVPGCAFGIVIGGELVYAGGLGVRNVADQTPVDQHTVFRIASMTKSFTAMALVKLRDAGQLQLDAPAADYVPELAALPYPTRDSAPMTVRQLLTMSAGLPQDDPWADRQLALSEAELSQILLKGLSFSNPPGVTFEYSNLGYAILGRIVTNVAGMPYQAYVNREILTPLGMTSTTFDSAAVDPQRLAMGYRREDDQWVEEPPLPDGAFASIGGLFTTIADFARYMGFLLSAFPPRDDDDSASPIRRSSAREMQQQWRQRALSSTRPSPDLPALVQGEAYGYGLACSRDSALGYSVAHGGGLPGYGTFYRLLPDYGIGIVGFCNATYASPRLAMEKVFTALRQTGGLTPRTLPTAPILRAVQDTLRQIYETWDDAALQAISTESFFQDMPLVKRREQFRRLRADFGKCRSVTPVEPENALRGRWIMQCSKGQIEVFATLAPTNPAKLQYLQITAARRLSPPSSRASRSSSR
ncbi:MAG: beta-lactamase family protein [Chloroflexi bacterium]|uniref:serine hydrolase domain-containing protein n=1 Tax=Candidatus Flexifilum breve TaxID=3140694 RepID=UPI0031361D22|nr:beta-lactamase family protein [Chloroflexota bacterium]